MTRPHTHNWTPIEDLPADWQSLAKVELANYVQVWQEEKARLEGTEAYDEFLQRLRREWAIETGVIERLYSISEGASRTLIEKGLDAALLTREDTDQSPERVVAIIRDQQLALEGLYQYVTEQRALSTSYIRQLHQVLTTNQEFCDAVDTLGNFVQVRLIRGEWKKHPNNIQFEDGSTFEFCPPEQVASELDRLVAMHQEHTQLGVPPEVEAAWLHHRFTLIHPFQDGNGRMARCLSTLVLLRAHWLPLVVTRKDRADYLQALRQADVGDLAPLVRLFGELQRRDIRHALSLSGDVVRDKKDVAEILAGAAEKLATRRTFDDRLAALVKACDALHVLAEGVLMRTAEAVQRTLCEADPALSVSVDSAKRNQRSKLRRYDEYVRVCAKALGYHTDFEVHGACVALIIDRKGPFKTFILLSFHGIGERRAGVLGGSAVSFVSSGPSIFTPGPRDVLPLSQQPFEVTYLDDQAQVVERFRKWLDECVKEGLKRWSESL